MSDFRFANPNWIHAVWLVAGLVVVLFWLDWRRADGLSRLLSATMQPRLVQSLSRMRRWSSIGLLGLAGVSLVVALMRPQWGLTYHETPQVGAQIMVCLDVSKSMLAEDTAPNRLERAKAELTDLLSYLQGDQVGLIAFAGRATVACPLTPDFGFFRLILDGVGPDTVGRGGTRLEEPIRKALDGFRTETDVSRVIVLITDGEDHDSHPLDAAKAAAERGIKILTIGFGDEAGSEIEYTDPQSSARTVVRDANGKPVITRLDGETLRQIALETEGAYIPAGTGALDLKSIYDGHIAPLVRGKQDARGHAVRREGFQWAVLCGLVFLVASIAAGSRNLRSELQAPWNQSSSSRVSKAGAAVLLLAVFAAVPCQAQQSPAEDAPPVVEADGISEAPPKEADRPKETSPEEQQDPRESYNQALALLDNDFDGAERLLTAARRDSGTDGEVRFRATYNLGWVEVKRADKLLGDKPQEALDHLRRAADWFRDAVRLRPDYQDARYNLEVVLKRILELADSLAKKEEGDLAQRLDALIGQQRNLMASSRQVVERVTALDDPNAADQFRSDFRQLAVEQRKLLSDSQALSGTAREELDVLNGKADKEKTPQDSLRAAQLEGVLHYTTRAEQRMGQARSQMRQRQAQRAFRRTATALDELKRARDQLRGPVEVLDVVLADAASLSQLTSLKAAAARPAVVVDPQQASEAPSWLTLEYLQDSQASLTERTSELVTRLQAGLDQQKNMPAGPPTPQQQQENAQADRFLAMVREAMPFLNKGKAAFESAGQSLASEQDSEAEQHQLEGIAALRDARERFLELRGLIELAYSRETQLQGLVTRVQPIAETKEAEEDENESALDSAESAMPPEQRAAALQIADVLQKENLDRSERIGKLIAAGLAELPDVPEADPAADPAKQDPAKQQAAAQRQQLELATEFLKQAQEEMAAASQSLTAIQGKADSTEADEVFDEEAMAASNDHVAKAVEHLQSLRRLFFSIVEHLRETAQRQAHLNDDTEQAAAVEDKEQQAKAIGPLAVRQQELQTISGEIAKALDEQAQQDAAGAAPGQQLPPEQMQQMHQIQENLAKAARLVEQGGGDMETAYKSLAFKQPLVDEARKHQDQALEKLVEALALLQPPQQDQQDQQNKQQQQQNQQQQDQQQEQKQDSEMGTNPARLLQAIRDREAQRRREQDRRAQIQREPVEKDW